MKAHWEKVFETKDTSKVSWYQNEPSLGLSLIKKYTPNKQAKILDIGGGDSRIPDFLLADNYTNLSVLDISTKALEISKNRLVENSTKITWINSDVKNFEAKDKYNLWYDRAVFHFLNTAKEQHAYKTTLQNALAKGAIAIIGAFSKNGNATRCSGVDISQHNKESFMALFYDIFDTIDYFEDTHTTPSGGEQLFSWIVLEKK